MKKTSKTIKFKSFKKFVVGLTLAIVMCFSSVIFVGCSNGKDGQKGQDGTTWYSGSETPTVEKYPAKIGDFYFDEDDNLIYKFTSNGWVLVSSLNGVGEPGEDGLTPHIGPNNNWWIGDADTGIKANGQDGEPGPSGTSFLSGIDDPDNNVGKDNDVYLNYISYDLFKKVNGNWVWIGNTKGSNQGAVISKVKTTKQGGLNNPVYLSENNIEDVQLNFKDNQNITIYGPNRFNNNKETFILTSYSSSTSISKENNGIKIETIDVDEIINSCYAYYDYTAEFDGKIWVSCDASCEGSVTDLGMRVSLNGTAQNLCRGEGRLEESVQVNKGDTVRVILYCRIGTKAANTIRYNNIMIQYNELTAYTDYVEDICSMQTKVTRVVDVSTLNFENMPTQAGNDSNHYAVKFTPSDTTPCPIPEAFRPTNNENLANVKVQGTNLVSYNAAYRNEVGLGISSSGSILIWLGEGYNKAVFNEWIKTHPITISYEETSETPIFVGISDLTSIKTGCVITSDDDFSVSYIYEQEEKVKNIVCFGDSITGMANNEADYVSMINRNTCYNAYNVGFAGASWAESKSSANVKPFSMSRLVDAVCSGDFSSQETACESRGDETYRRRLNTLKSIDFQTVDYITIFYGTNDWGSGVVLKSEDDVNQTDKQYSNVEDSINYSINKLKQTFPKAKIVVITPYRVSYNNRQLDSSTTANTNGDYLYDFVNYIEQISGNNNVSKVLNLHNLLPIDSSNDEIYTYDGTHPTAKLNNILSQLIVSAIDRFCN